MGTLLRLVKKRKAELDFWDYDCWTKLHHGRRDSAVYGYHGDDFEVYLVGCDTRGVQPFVKFAPVVSMEGERFRPAPSPSPGGEERERGQLVHWTNSAVYQLRRKGLHPSSEKRRGEIGKT